MTKIYSSFTSLRNFDKGKELNFLISLVIHRKILFIGLRAVGQTALT